ncbi:hypothetical protein PCH_Pc13g04770 [Penicillium rubens Wisconsin 54-1255]|uniref:Uncharacterized protein n=1 Tax=Penicillium rubens (strain ATCC 28089 / DSM 1075 / NRRL 1951 / Wisconsin 54-1255) TaxID=500485 RepID=B6H2C6_PENRW|nr:hypothetical protein PCH_Pc13g04770 [Penicillium rubens Wisconsin 54-1255]
MDHDAYTASHHVLGLAKYANDSYCTLHLTAVRACWRRLLSETDPRRTLDLEQNTDGQEHELDGLAMVISKTNYKPLSNRRLGPISIPSKFLLDSVDSYRIVNRADPPSPLNSGDGIVQNDVNVMLVEWGRVSGTAELYMCDRNGMPNGQRPIVPRSLGLPNKESSRMSVIILSLPPPKAYNADNSRRAGRSPDLPTTGVCHRRFGKIR